MHALRVYALATVAVIGLAGASAPGSAQTPEEFYKGKNISVMIGYGPGGSDDLWARIIAKYLGDHIPGHPTGVPANIPGAGSLKLANQIYNKEVKDGTVIGLINRGVLFEPLLGGDGILFDPLKLTFIGSPDRDTAVCAARKDTAVQTWQDLATKELTVGATGSGADTEVYPNFLKNMLDLKFKVVSGYTGSKEINIAVERNEVQGICVSYDTIARENIFKSGVVHLLFQAALKPDPRLQDVPAVLDFAKTDQQRAAAALSRTHCGGTALHRTARCPRGSAESPARRLRADLEGPCADRGSREGGTAPTLCPAGRSPEHRRRGL
jgi:tripartite-type tricarboxylate transporter receptor subunit TctC